MFELIFQSMYLQSSISVCQSVPKCLNNILHSVKNVDKIISKPPSPKKNSLLEPGGFKHIFLKSVGAVLLAPYVRKSEYFLPWTLDSNSSMKLSKFTMNSVSSFKLLCKLIKQFLLPKNSKTCVALRTILFKKCQF